MAYLKTIVGLLTIVLISSCSNVKVLATKKVEEREGLQNKNILVIARTAKQDVRKAFEDEITAELLKMGLNAVASHDRFPALLPDEKVAEEKKEEIREMIEKAGFNGVVLSVLQDHQELTRKVGGGDYYASVNYGYIDWPSYYGWGFYTYYYHPLSYSTEDIYVEGTEDTITAQLYVLDTIAFNLDLPEKEQFVRMVRAQIENPESAASTARSYAKAIAKTVKKS